MSHASGRVGRISTKGLIDLTLTTFRGDSTAGALARGGTWSFVFRVATLVVAAVAQIVLVKVLGEVDYGRYTYVLGWANVAVVFTVFNFEYASVKYVAKYHSARALGLLRGFERTATSFTTLLSVGTAVVLALLVWLLAPGRASDLRVPAIIACGMIPVLTALSVNSERLRGRRLIAQSHIHEVLRPLLLLGTVIIAAYLMGVDVDVSVVLALNLAGALVVGAINGGLAFRSSLETRAAAPEYRRREWFGTAVGLMPMAIAQLALGSKTDVVIVGSFVDTTAAGVYSISALLMAPTSFIVASTATIAGPMIADYYGNQRFDELRKLVVLIARINIGLTVPIVLAIYVVAPFVLAWLGPAFTAGYPVVLLLGIAAISSTLGGHAALMSTMTGHHNRASLIIGSCAVLNLLLAIVLGYLFGVTGVAAATTIAQVTRSVALTIAAKRFTGISLMPF
jgi:O-antigen/teichoic acid export membrane protein